MTYRIFSNRVQLKIQLKIQFLTSTFRRRPGFFCIKKSEKQMIKPTQFICKNFICKNSLRFCQTTLTFS